MDTVVCSVCSLSVALIFYTYRAYREYLGRKVRTLRERVAFMLWTAANGIQ